MAKKSGESKGSEARASAKSPEHVKVNGGDIYSAARGFEGESFEKGYPGIANSDMHNNQGRGGARLKGK